MEKDAHFCPDTPVTRKDVDIKPLTKFRANKDVETVICLPSDEERVDEKPIFLYEPTKDKSATIVLISDDDEEEGAVHPKGSGVPSKGL